MWEGEHCLEKKSLIWKQTWKLEMDLFGVFLERIWLELGVRRTPWVSLIWSTIGERAISICGYSSFKFKRLIIGVGHLIFLNLNYSFIVFLTLIYSLFNFNSSFINGLNFVLIMLLYIIMLIYLFILTSLISLFI